jgi:hypothetical protein
MLDIIKTEDLLDELAKRCSDQLLDPEPQYDGVLSFLNREELDELQNELILASTRAKSLAKSWRKDDEMN